jgi:ABC-type sugar transport system ATPase subunit
MNLIPGRLDTANGGLVLEVGAMRLALPEALAHAYRSHAGKDVTAGFRPEDFSLAPKGVLTAPVPLSVIAGETLGPEVIIVGEIGGKGGPEVHAKAPRDFVARPGATLELHYDLGEIHIFDAGTGIALKRPAHSPATR